MSTRTHELAFKGDLLERGFWLYVWEITTQQRGNFYYIGRTGDSSSFNAQSPFNRMGQHLGSKSRSNALRRKLEANSIEPERCNFRLVAHGPIFEEAKMPEEYRLRRDKIGAMEKALADAMCASGYQVLNTVSCKVRLDEVAFAEVRGAFGQYFPKLSRSVNAASGAR